MTDAPIESETESASIREEELEELSSDLRDWIPMHNEPGAHWSHNHRWCRHRTRSNAREILHKVCFLAFEMHHTHFRAGANCECGDYDESVSACPGYLNVETTATLGDVLDETHFAHLRTDLADTAITESYGAGNH